MGFFIAADSYYRCVYIRMCDVSGSLQASHNALEALHSLGARALSLRLGSGLVGMHRRAGRAVEAFEIFVADGESKFEPGGRVRV